MDMLADGIMQLWGFFTDGAAVQSWVSQYGAFAPLALAALICAQVAVAIIPGELLEMGAGLLFGFWGGTAVCLAGSLAGTLIVLALVRALGMRVVRLFFSPAKLESISWLRDTKRFEAVLFVVFLIPGTPKDLLTYVAGLTTCPWYRIALLTTVGRIPSIVTSTLTAAFAVEGNLFAAGAVLFATIALVVAGAAVLPRIRKRCEQR